MSLPSILGKNEQCDRWFNTDGFVQLADGDKTDNTAAGFMWIWNTCGDKIKNGNIRPNGPPMTYLDYVTSTGYSEARIRALKGFGLQTTADIIPQIQTKTYAKGELLMLLQDQTKNPSYSLSEATAMVNANLQFINDADKTGNNNTGRTALIWASQSHAPNLVYALIVAGANPNLNFVAATDRIGRPTKYLGALEAANQENKGTPADLYIIDILTRAKGEWTPTGKVNPSNYRPFSSGGRRKYRGSRKQRKNRSRRRKHTKRR
jgi:hypothetical protein